MSRLIDRCLMLAAGGLLGFAAVRAADPPAESAAPAGIVAAAAPASPASPPSARSGRDPEMEALVDQVVRLRPERDRRRLGPLSVDEIDRCLVVARDIDPPLYEGLMALREADPDEFLRRLQGSGRLRFLANLRQDEPHLYELKLIELRTDREVARLSDELRAAAAREDAVSVSSLRPQLVMQMRLQQSFILLARKQTLDRMREKLEMLDREYQRDVATVDERIAAAIDGIISGSDSPGPASDPAPGSRGTPRR
jgi:hypothetical protein